MTTTENTDPVPEEIRDRIERARSAVDAVVSNGTGASGDHAAYYWALAAAKRELADAYKAAYESVRFPAQTLHYAAMDASNALRMAADDYDREARESERAAALGHGTGDVA